DAARDPGSVFRVIITGPDGRAAAFGQATPITQTTPVTPATLSPAARTPGDQLPGDQLPGDQSLGERHTGGTQLPLPSLGSAGDPPDNPGMPLAGFTPAPGSRDGAGGRDGYGLWRLRVGGTVYSVRLDPVPGPGPCTHGY